MRVLVAPGSFGPLAPDDAARALASGWSGAAPTDVVDTFPLLGLDEVPALVVASADLVLTGEAVVDAVSLLGAVGALAAAAQEAGVPCLVVAGQVAVGRREAAARGIDEAHVVGELTVHALTEAAARLARQWSR